jgi:CheY-like chemotaxis protein
MHDLRLEEVSVQPVVQSNSTSLYRLDGCSILLVDDTVDNQLLFKYILQSAGAVVEIASNGREAVQQCERTSYDLIIMDMRMPILDGYTATALIRSFGYEGPIIALTAHSTPGEEERCLRAGCSEFLLKPIDRSSLIVAVYSALF